MSEWAQGLWVSGVGLGLTFLALALFVLIILALMHLAPAEKKVRDQREVPAQQRQAASDQIDEPTVALMAAAIYLHGRRIPGNTSEVVTPARGPWWTARHQAVLSARPFRRGRSWNDRR